MRKFALMLSLAALLAGCGAQTRYSVDLDLAGFLKAAGQDQGTVDLGTPTPIGFQAYLPDDDNDLSTPDTKGYLAQVPEQVASTLEKAEIELAGEIENQGTGDLTLQAALYLAPASESNIYQPGYKLGQANLDPSPLASGKSGVLALSVVLREGDSGYQTIQSGGGQFRIGLELQGTGQKFRYRITGFRLKLTTRPLGSLVRGF